MSSFRIRPRFNFNVEMTSEELEKRLKYLLKQPDAPCAGLVIPGYITLKIPVKERHFWSPQLNLTLEVQEKGTLVRGLYGPNPTVWTMFMFVYLAVGTVALFAGMFGFSQRSLGMESSILWSLPVLGGIAFGVYIFAQMGQKIGAEQMFFLHHVLEETVGQRIHVN